LSTFIVDASVAVRWLVDLPFAKEARVLLTHRNRLLAPELLQAEVGSALLKLVRGKVLSRTDGEGAFEDFFRAPVRMVPALPVAHHAMKVALQSGQSFYDCLYLALAESEQGLFATADGRFWQAMKTTPHARHIYFIGDPV
jgi:predicted nucleic acid-binding protein